MTGNEEKLAELFRKVIEEIGEDANREGLIKTPERTAKSLYFLTSGYREDLDSIINGAVFESSNDEMIIVRDIELYSLCEHHILPFVGKCHVGYIPDGKVIGISKIPRIVNHFARRLQIQENLTAQIAEAVKKYTGAKGVAVVIEAKHLCMMMRGVGKQNATMVTSCLLGLFKTKHETRAEFMKLVKD